MGISFLRGPVGEPWEGSVYRELWEIVEGCLRKWSISHCGRPVRGPWRRTRRLFAGDPIGYERKALETGISLNGGSAGQPGVEWAHLPATLRDS